MRLFGIVFFFIIAFAFDHANSDWGMDKLLNYKMYPHAYMNPVPIPNFKKFVTHYEDISIINPQDNNPVLLFWIPFEVNSTTPRKTVFYFHGNGEYRAHSVEFLSKLQKLLQANIIIMEYRGYNHAPGKPTRPTLISDAETALHWARKREDVKNDDIVIYGHSLGGAVASALYGSHPDDISSVILECTFASVRELLAPFGLKHLSTFVDKLEDNWDSAAQWQSVVESKKIPKVLMLGGYNDYICPVRNMKTLFGILEENPEDNTYSPEEYLSSTNPTKTKRALIIFKKEGHLVHDNPLMRDILLQFFQMPVEASSVALKQNSASSLTISIVLSMIVMLLSLFSC